MKHTMKKFLALVMALMLSLSAFALAEEALDAPQAVEQPGEAAEPESPEGQEPEAPQEPQAEPEDGEADAGEDVIAIEAVDAVYAEQSADLVEEEPDLPADEAADLPVEEDVYSEDAANVKEQGLVDIYLPGGDYPVQVGWKSDDGNVWTAKVGDGSATLDIKSLTLTLKDCTDVFNISISANTDSSEAQESPFEAMYNTQPTVPEFTIVLKGNNKIIGIFNGTTGGNYLSYPIRTNGCHLTIEGDGKLTIETILGIQAEAGITVAGGTIEIDETKLEFDFAEPCISGNLSVTGGKLTLKAQKRVVHGSATADLSKIDVFYGEDEANVTQLSASATEKDWYTLIGSRYARFEAKEEEKKPDEPTTPTTPAAPTTTPSVDLMFCRLTCKDANGNPIKNGFTVKWSAMDGVDGYDVFMARCGKKYALAGTVEKGNPTSLTVENLKVGKCYKAYVAPYVMKGSEKVYLGKSKKAHAFTNNGNDKKTNPAGIRVKEKRTVRVGKKKALNAKILSMDTNKDLVNHVRKIRYFSSNPNVATVSRKGKVKGVGVGDCVIYVLANNGICKQVAITVIPAK